MESPSYYGIVLNNPFWQTQPFQNYHMNGRQVFDSEPKCSTHVSIIASKAKNGDTPLKIWKAAKY